MELYISSYSQQTEPKPHIIFNIRVKTASRTFNVSKRYSDFVQLHAKLVHLYENLPQLPPKYYSILQKSTLDPILIENRRRGLNKYLVQVQRVAEKSRVWMEFFMIQSSDTESKDAKSHGGANKVSGTKSQVELKYANESSISRLQKPQSKPSSNRKFGIQETSETLNLDNTGILSLQDTYMRKQDDVLEGLSGVVSRQKNIALAIGNELESQIDILEGVEDGIGRINRRVGGLENKMKKVL